MAPEPSWSDGQTLGRRTPEPRGGQCARAPHSLLKVSASRGCSYSGILETFRAPSPTRLILDLRSQSWLLPQVSWKPAEQGDRGDSCICKLAQVWGSTGRGPRLGASPGPAHRGLAGDIRTGHGELKLESGEWEAADKAISRALHHAAPVSSSCSINLILGASLPPPAGRWGGGSALRPAGSAGVSPAAPWFGKGQQWSFYL